MKLKLLIPALALATQLQASQLNETADYTLFNQSWSQNIVEFFDEYRTIPYFGPDGQWHDPQGWVSLYGALNGGTLFSTNASNVSWDFTDTPFTMRWLLTYTEDNQTLYRISSGSYLTGQGKLPPGTDIIAFFGTGPGTKIPETDNTMLLLGFALVGLLFYDKKATR